MCVSDEQFIRLAGKERNRTFAPRGYLSLLPVRVRPKIVRFTVRVRSGGADIPRRQMFYIRGKSSRRRPTLTNVDTGVRSQGTWRCITGSLLQ